MTPRLRVLATGLASGRWNTAMSAALLQTAADSGDLTIMRFYRFERCVLLGASQVPGNAADLGYCAQEGIEIARRITGGGSVYMSPTMLAWDVVMPLAGTVEASSALISATFGESLRDLGLRNVSSSALGISHEGRKISGAATTSLKGQILYQGTLLVVNEVRAMAAALGAPEVAIEAAVTSLADAGFLAADFEALQDIVVRTFARRFNLNVVYEALAAPEMALATREFAREVGTDAFVSGEDAHQFVRTQA